MLITIGVFVMYGKVKAQNPDIAFTKDNVVFAWGDGLKCDRDGRIYVATRLGIQVLDQLGRVNVIILAPTGESSNLCFGGKDFDTLYVSCTDKIYKRKVKTKSLSLLDYSITLVACSPNKFTMLTFNWHCKKYLGYRSFSLLRFSKICC